MGTERHGSPSRSASRRTGFIVLTQVMGTESEQARPKRNGTGGFHCIDPGNGDWKIKDSVVFTYRSGYKFHCIDPGNGDWKLKYVGYSLSLKDTFHCIDPGNGDWKSLAVWLELCRLLGFHCIDPGNGDWKELTAIAPLNAEQLVSLYWPR